MTTSFIPNPFSTANGVTDANYLVGTAHLGLSAEIVVGTTPGGELGGTWASPTVDTTHSGSAHMVKFTSSDLTITSAGALTLAHGLGSKPFGIQVILKCTTADNGYALNEEVVDSPTGRQVVSVALAAAGTGYALKIDATNIYVRFGSLATNCISILDDDAGTMAVLPNTSWAFIVRAWV